MKKQLTHNQKLNRDFYTTLYCSLQQHQQNRKQGDLSFNKKELIQWFRCQQNHKQLLKNWVKGGCTKALKPTVNRIDDAIPYEFSNMELMSFKNNHHLQVIRAATPVVQTTADGEVVAIYPSIRIATETLRVSKNRIGKAIKRNTKVNGYLFKVYNKEEFKR